MSRALPNCSPSELVAEPVGSDMDRILVTADSRSLALAEVSRQGDPLFGWLRREALNRRPARDADDVGSGIP